MSGLRRNYSLTDKGRAALADWRSAPSGELSELRDHGLLKLFFGADPSTLAPVQLEAHRAKLAEYEALSEADSGASPRGPWLALHAGVRLEREWIRYWEDVAATGRNRATRPRARGSARRAS